MEKLEGQNVDTAKVKGIAWAEGAKNIRLFEEGTAQKFTNGMQVLAQVRVEFHSIHGFSLILTNIDQSFTLGNLERQRRETLLRLVNENPGIISKVGEDYSTRNKLLPLAAVIQKVALIASPNSEGYNDFLHTMRNNQFGYKFHIDEYRSSVQGSPAEGELVATLVKIFNSGIKYDCVAIVRGGGARTDFLVFDTYRVSVAVAKFPIPVITGIGHHKDVSITDLMAHTVTKTPTKAAEFIIAHAHSFEQEVQKFQKNIVIKAQQLLSASTQQINAANSQLLSQAGALITRHNKAIALLNSELMQHTRTLLYNRRSALTLSNQVVVNKAKAKLHSSLVNITQLNGQLVGKTSTLLQSAAAGLQTIKQNLRAKPSNTLQKLQAALTQAGHNAVSSSNKHLHSRQRQLTENFHKIASRSQIICNRRADELKNTIAGLSSNIPKYIAGQRSSLEHRSILVKAMSPRNILKKGFAMVSQNGRVLKDSKAVTVGSNLTITMNDTDINTKVISKTQNNE